MSGHQHSKTWLIGVFVLCGVLVTTVSPRPAKSMTLSPASLDELAQLSELTVHAVVVSITPEHALPKQPRIQTRVTCYVYETLKGKRAKAGEFIDIILPGGRLGRVRTIVPGVPSMHIGEELLMVLTRVPGGWAPIGYEMGIIRPKPGSAPAPHIVDTLVRSP